MAENHHIDAEPPPRRMNSSDISRWSAALLLSAAVIALNWRLALTDQFTWFAGPENAQHVLPALQFQAAEWQRGRIPMWNPNNGGGRFLITQPEAAPTYPLNWLLFSLPLHDGRMRPLVLNWYFVLIHLMGAWFAYRLARELGCARWGAIAGGIVFSATGWFGAAMSPYALNGAVWAPLVLRCQIRATNGRTPLLHGVLSGFFLGMAWLSGDWHVPLMISLAGVCVWIWAVARNRRIAPAALLSLLMAGASGALYIVPLLKSGAISNRQPVEQSAGFFAVTIAALVILGALAAWRQTGIRIIAAAGMGAAFFAMSKDLPGALMLMGLAAAMLVAKGFDTVLAVEPPQWIRWVGRVSVIIGLAAMAWHLVLVEMRGFPGTTNPGTAITGLTSLLFAGLLYAVLRSHLSGRAVACCLLGLVLLEASNSPGFVVPTYLEKTRVATLDAMKQHGDLADFLRRQPGSLRVEVDEKLVPYDFGTWFGLPQFDEPRIGMKRLMSVAYAIGREPAAFQRSEVFSGSSGLKVYSNADVLPRASVAHEVSQCTGKDEVALVAYAPNRVRIRATMACRGMVILNDAWSPDWRATVDRTATQVLVVQPQVRGVMVPAGTHEIEFHFRPGAVFAGGLFTLLAWAGVLILVLASRVRRRNGEA